MIREEVWNGWTFRNLDAIFDRCLKERGERIVGNEIWGIEGKFEVEEREKGRGEEWGWVCVGLLGLCVVFVYTVFTFYY